MKHLIRQIVAQTILLLAWQCSSKAQLAPCYAGFELSAVCITARGLDQRVGLYRRKIAQAMVQLGASYDIRLRPVNHPVEAGYDAVRTGDVFTEVVRDEEMRSESFIINVTAEFLEKQPEILFEASSLHEVCHIMNDDLAGYHRNGENIEAAEEHCVLQAVGEARYREYLKAYAAYQHWDAATYELVLQKVKDVVLVSAPRERDKADVIAAAYFREHADGREHLLVYNGELHDVTHSSTRDTVRYDPEKLKSIITAGKPIVFFQNHPPEGGRAAMFPSHSEFRLAALSSFLVYREQPQLAVEFRLMQLGAPNAVVSYGFKGTALEEIRRKAEEYRKAVREKADTGQIEASQEALDDQLDQESFEEYLQHVCPTDPDRPNTEGCRTVPQYFLWPSERFFVHDRPQ